jgi:protein tyrosine phosphatase
MTALIKLLENFSLHHLRLTSREEVPAESLPDLLAHKEHITRVFLTLQLTDDLNLAVFTSLPQLHTLALRLIVAAPLNAPGIWPINYTLFQSLHSLTLENSLLHGSFVENLTNIPLVHLSLKGSRFCNTCELDLLATHNTLRVLNITNVSGPSGRNIWKGYVLQLRKAMPHTVVLPKNPHTDFTDYRGVISPDRLLEYSYSFDEIRAGVSKQDLSRILELGEKEEENWDIHKRNTYRHNRCPIPESSYIKSVDNRVRIAAREPITPYEIREFWRYAAERNVKVVVMVKHHHGESDTTYLDSQYVETVASNHHEERGYTHTLVKVGDHTVHHVQIDWMGGYGLPVTTLYSLILKVIRLENANPGQTLVHCQEGVGRTITFLACHNLYLMMQEVDKSLPLWFNVELYLRAYRQQRQCSIETENQLGTVLDFQQFLLQN